MWVNNKQSVYFYFSLLRFYNLRLKRAIDVALGERLKWSTSGISRRIAADCLGEWNEV